MNFFSPRGDLRNPLLSPPPPLPNVRIKASVLPPLANLSKEGPAASFYVHSYLGNARSTLDANARFRRVQREIRETGGERNIIRLPIRKRGPRVFFLIFLGFSGYRGECWHSVSYRRVESEVV